MADAQHKGCLAIGLQPQVNGLQANAEVSKWPWAWQNSSPAFEGINGTMGLGSSCGPGSTPTHAQNLVQR